MDSQQANQLVEAAVEQRGGDPANELFYERIYFSPRLAANDADAADLTQRTFSRVWQALPTFAGRSSVASWIHSIAHHVYVDWRRANHRTESRQDEWWLACAATDSRPTKLLPVRPGRSAFAAVDRQSRSARQFICITTRAHIAGNRRRTGVLPL
jgi:DNA-directed RNA polymerase specialized sigma24 family protein